MVGRRGMSTTPFTHHSTGGASIQQSLSGPVSRRKRSNILAIGRCFRHPMFKLSTDIDVKERSGSFLVVTLGCDHGTLTLSPASGLRFIAGDTTVRAGKILFDGVASFYARLDDANNALGSMTYRPHRDWNGNDTLNVAADDRGWSSEVRLRTLLSVFSSRVSVSLYATVVVVAVVVVCLHTRHEP